MNLLVIDTETIANEHAKAYYQQKTYYPPANLADPNGTGPSEITKLKDDALRKERLKQWRIDQMEKVNRSITEQRHADQQKAALTWWTAQIVAIHAIPITGDQPPRQFSGLDERLLLQEFFDFCANLGHPTLGGKSSEDFDVPMLRGRAIALNIGIPESLRVNRLVADCDQIFAFSHANAQRSTLANYAWGLQIPGKTGTGSDVQNWINQIRLGNTELWQDLHKYNAQDNAIAAEMLRRYHKAYVPTRQRKPDETEVIPHDIVHTVF